MTDWIAADWGSTNLRLWGMEGGEVLWTARSDEGAAGLSPDAFAPALAAAIADRAAKGTPVVACGMLGSRGAWHEVLYAAVPCAPATATTRIDAPTGPVHIVHGLSQLSPPDVMRGEETQIAGFLAAEPGFDGTVLLPGTHSKWVHVSAGEVVSFRTCLTGELFALLSTRSALRGPADTPWDDAAFAAAVSDTLSRPERLASDLFSLRADWLLNGTPGRARLSGLLIGAEIAATKPWWLGREVAIVGEGTLARLYESALEAEGVAARPRDADDLTLRGLKAAHAAIGETA